MDELIDDTCTPLPYDPNAVGYIYPSYSRNRQIWALPPGCRSLPLPVPIMESPLQCRASPSRPRLHTLSVEERRVLDRHCETPRRAFMGGAHCRVE